jgi:hypothetical protein
LVNFYQTSRHYNPEDSHLRTDRRENLKSYKSILVSALDSQWKKYGEKQSSSGCTLRLQRNKMAIKKAVLFEMLLWILLPSNWDQ